MSHSGNFNVPGQGPSRNEYPRSHHYRTTQTPYGPGVGHGAGYDMPHASQHSPVGPGPSSEYVYPVQPANLNPPYPLGFVAQQSLRPGLMTPPRPLSQDSASVWDPWAGPRSFQAASESHSHHIPGGFAFQQSVRCVAAASLSQRRASVQSVSGGPYPRTTLVTRKRRALVIGTNYPHSDPRYWLKSCTEDAYCMANLLRHKLGFARDDIRIITDDNLGDLPTKDNIIEAMKTLVRDAQPGDSFFFYFSGHGTQIKDLDGDEVDGLDECILAMDYRGDVEYPDADTPGLIVDDTMNKLMVEPLPPGCRLTAIFDCCHSGTILDLPVVYNSKGAAKPFIHQDGPWIGSQKISSADVVSLSASKDNQEAAESSLGGALRWAFIDSVSKFGTGNTLTYQALIRNMRDYMVRHGFEQKPQLSTSHKIDTNQLFVI